MAVESRHSTDRRVLFREVFTPDSIAKNGGVITGGVSLSNGVATMDGTGYITYPKLDTTGGPYTFRIRYKSTNISQAVLYHFSGAVLSTLYMNRSGGDHALLYLTGNNYRYFNNVSASFDGNWHEMILHIDGSAAADILNASMYIDGSVLVNGGTNSTGTPVLWTTFVVGARPDTPTSRFIGDIDLLEIYQGSLVDEEISLLYDNKLYSGFIQENCILHADYTRGTSLNWKDTDGTHTDINTTYLHNIGVNCDTTTKIEYGTALAVTGDWSLETVVDRNGTGDFYPIGVTAGDRGVYIDFGSSGDWGFYDGTTDLTAEAAVTCFNRQHLVVTKTGTSYKFYRGGILVNTVVGVDTDITQITVGMLGDGTGGMNGNVVYTREYTSVLSAENVAQNHQYAVDNYGAI